MPIIQLIVVLIVVGLIVWLVQTFLPIDPRIKMVIIALVVLLLILWLLSTVGLLGGTLYFGPHVR